MPKIQTLKITGRRLRQQEVRLQAAELFARGYSRQQVVKTCKVTWRSAHNWYQQWKQAGKEGLIAKTKPGPAEKFNDNEVKEIEKLLRRGAIANGYSNELWTLPRIARLIIDKYQKKVSQSEVWRLLRRMGWTLQRPKRKARERDEEKIKEWKEVNWPKIMQKAKDEQRTIIFVDESGFSIKPSVSKTWAPAGETPVLELNFNWDKLSVIGGISLKSIYFQILEESVKSDQVIAFLEYLQKHISGKLLIIWDGLPAHRSKKVAEYLGSTKGNVWVERLPAYAPELNPIEYLWGYVKKNELANFAPRELYELSTAARDAIFKANRTPRLIRAFWVQTELNLNNI